MSGLITSLEDELDYSSNLVGNEWFTNWIVFDSNFNSIIEKVWSNAYDNICLLLLLAQGWNSIPALNLKENMKKV